MNPLYLIYIKVNGYFEEINGNKYSMLALTNEIKKELKSMKNYGVKSEMYLDQ